MLASSPLVVEELAFREAISLAANLQMDHIIVESDSLDLIHACRGECPKGEIMQILQDILHLKTGFMMCGFTWVERSGNMLAYTLVKLENTGSLPHNWRWCPPPAVKEILDKEKGQVKRQRERPFLHGILSIAGSSERNSHSEV